MTQRSEHKQTQAAPRERERRPLPLGIAGTRFPGQREHATPEWVAQQAASKMNPQPPILYQTLKRDPPMRQFAIHLNGLQEASGNTPEEATEVFVHIYADGTPLTNLLETNKDRVLHRPAPRLSAYRLAEWLVENALHILTDEPPPEDDFEWDMSHSLAAAGYGYIWPNITFNRHDGDLTVTSTPTTDPYQHINYLGANAGRPILITHSSFERALNKTVTAVLEHLNTKGFTDTELHCAVQHLESPRPVQTGQHSRQQQEHKPHDRADQNRGHPSHPDGPQHLGHEDDPGPTPASGPSQGG